MRIGFRGRGGTARALADFVARQNVCAARSMGARAGGTPGPRAVPRRGAARRTENRDGIVARRPNYGFEKRQKELRRQEKQADKAERKRLRREGGEDSPDAVAQPDGDDGGQEPGREGDDE